MGKPALSLEAGAFWADLNNEHPLYFVAVVVKREPWRPFEPWQNFQLSLEDFARLQEDGRALRAALNQLRKLYPSAPPDMLLQQ